MFALPAARVEQVPRICAVLIDAREPATID
jgi:hypothetical protein